VKGRGTRRTKGHSGETMFSPSGFMSPGATIFSPSGFMSAGAIWLCDHAAVTGEVFGSAIRLLLHGSS
jgi:hypothetical protein